MTVRPAQNDPWIMLSDQRGEESIIEADGDDLPARTAHPGPQDEIEQNTILSDSSEQNAIHPSHFSVTHQITPATHIEQQLEQAPLEDTLEPVPTVPHNSPVLTPRAGTTPKPPREDDHADLNEKPQANCWKSFIQWICCKRKNE